MREGSLEAPTRHVIDWQDPDFTDPEKLDAEMRRQFDVCHTCRRCFNLCDSFPRLFDLIDNSATGELDAVKTGALDSVVEACTLCDMCFMTKCPYVPPHPFNIDFPHLMLRARAADLRHGKSDFAQGQLAKTDRNGRLAAAVAPVVNWGSDVGNKLTRPVVEKVVGIDRRADLPEISRPHLCLASEDGAAAPRHHGPREKAQGRDLRHLFRQLQQSTHRRGADGGAGEERRRDRSRLSRLLRHADAGTRRSRAGRGRREKDRGGIGSWLDRGFDIVAPVPSCALMLKFEWPLIVPDDPAVKRLAQATFDGSEYLVDIAKKEGLAPGLKPLPGGVTVHLACHARAQNVRPESGGTPPTWCPMPMSQ